MGYGKDAREVERERKQQENEEYENADIAERVKIDVERFREAGEGQPEGQKSAYRARKGPGTDRTLDPDDRSDEYLDRLESDLTEYLTTRIRADPDAYSQEDAEQLQEAVDDVITGYSSGDPDQVRQGAEVLAEKGEEQLGTYLVQQAPGTDG